MGKSAVNKGIATQEDVDIQIDDVLSDLSPALAHKTLAALMTQLKLGGKQRKRYREILDSHLGLTPAEGAAATAEGLSDDNPLKSKLAAKAAAKPSLAMLQETQQDWVVTGKKGMSNKPFKKSFKSEAARSKWIEENSGDLSDLAYSDPVEPSPAAAESPEVDAEGMTEASAAKFARSAKDGEAQALIDAISDALTDTAKYPANTPARSKLVAALYEPTLQARAAQDKVRAEYPEIGKHLQLPTGFYDAYGNGDAGVARDLATGLYAGKLSYAARRIFDGTYPGMRPETEEAVLQAFMDSLEDKIGRPPGNLYGELAEEGGAYTKGALVRLYKDDVDASWAKGDDPIVIGVPSGAEVGIPRSEVSAIRRLLYAFRNNEYDLESWLSAWNADHPSGVTASAARDGLRRRVRPDSPGVPVQAAGEPTKARKKALKGRVHGGRC